MSWFDLAALVVVALAVFDGARNGLAWALLEGAFLVIAAVVARLLSSRVEPYVLKFADLEREDLQSCAHLVVFAAAACVLAGTMFLLHPASKRWRFRHDRWFGAGIGVVNGIVAALVLFSIFIWARPRPAIEESLATSRLVPLLRAAQGHGLAGILPEHTDARLAQLERP